MNKKNLVVLLFVLLTIIIPSIIKAQVKNSVYSMLGIGYLIDNSFGINKALGGTGIAFQTENSINYLNPASYIGILPNSEIFEAGVHGMYSTSATKNNSQIDSEINLTYLSISFYFADWWATSFGIVPYSYVDYEIDVSGEIEGEPTALDKSYTGTGGLSRLYFGNSFKIYKGLSVGFNASYITGPITHTETAYSNDSFAGYQLEHKLTASSFYLDYGMQYYIANNDWQYRVGLIYGASKKLNTTDDLQFTYNETIIALEQDEDLFAMKIPQKFGVGISVKKDKIFRVGLDYEWSNWSHINFSNYNLETKNSNRFSFGMEYYPSENIRDSWLRSFYYRMGVNYKNSYLEIKGIQINSMGISFGVGVPFGETSIINFSLEYGEEGTLNKGLIKNSYWRFYLNFSLHEFWSVL